MFAAIELLRYEAEKTAGLRSLLTGVLDGSIPLTEQNNVMGIVRASLNERQQKLETIADLLVTFIQNCADENEKLVGHA